MAKRIISVAGYNAFKNAIQPYKKPDLVYCFFSGSKGDDGESWCGICVAAEPVILDSMKKYAKNHAVLIYAEVGNKEEYFDKQNPFRTDKDVRLKVIPAIQRWKHAWALRGKFCTREDLLKKFFLEHAD